MIITNASEQLISLFERVTGCEVSGIENTSVDYLADIIEGELDANEGCIRKLKNQLAKQQEEIARLTVLAEWLIALNDDGCLINSLKFSQSELTKLLSKYNKGEK